MRQNAYNVEKYVPSVRAVRLALQHSIDNEAVNAVPSIWCAKIHTEVLFEHEDRWCVAEMRDSDTDPMHYDNGEPLDITLRGVVVVGNAEPNANDIAEIRESMEFELTGTTHNLVLGFKCYADQFNKFNDIIQDMLFSVGLADKAYHVWFDFPDTTVERGTRIGVNVYVPLAMSRSSAAWVEEHTKCASPEFYHWGVNYKWLCDIGFNYDTFTWNHEFHSIGARELRTAYCEAHGIDQYRLCDIEPLPVTEWDIAHSDMEHWIKTSQQ